MSTDKRPSDAKSPNVDGALAMLYSLVQGTRGPDGKPYDVNLRSYEVIERALRPNDAKPLGLCPMCGTVDPGPDRAHILYGNEPSHRTCIPKSRAEELTRGPRPDKVIAAPRELHCEDCNRDYAPWFAPSPLWNQVVRAAADAAGVTEPYLCASCFAVRAEAAGVRPTAWVLQPEDKRVDYAIPKAIFDRALKLVARVANYDHGEDCAARDCEYGDCDCPSVVGHEDDIEHVEEKCDCGVHEARVLWTDAKAARCSDSAIPEGKS